MRALLLLLAVSSGVAAAAPPPSPSRVGVLLIPMDKGAEQHVVKIEKYAVESLNEYKGLTVRPTDELFGMPPDDEAEASLKRAEVGYGESRAAFDGRNWEDAERKLRATLKEYGKAAAAMKGCGKLCDAVAMYAASLNARGEVEESKIAILDLLSLSPTFELDRKRFPQEFISLRAQVATSRNAQLRGNVNVLTRPSGARVYLDGEFQGYTPMSLQTLPIGKHILRLERPGFKQQGMLVEITPEDQEVTKDLVPTPGYKAYDSMLDTLAADVLKDRGGGSMSSLGKTLGLDRALVAVLKEVNESGGVELAIGYYDMRAGKKLASKKATFQGDEYGQLKSEIGRMVNHLLNQAASGGERVSRGGDPLDGKSGMEDWNQEDRGGNRTRKETKKKGDPLDGHSGMEDW